MNIKNNSLALKVWNDKYRIKDEKTPEDSIRRIRKEFSKTILERYTDFLNNNKVINYKELSSHGRLFFNDLMSFIKRHNESDNSEEIVPCLYEINWDSIIPGGSGIFGIGNLESNSSISNCFVIDSPHDSLEGINYSINEMCALEKARGGVGINLSTIRPKKARVNNQSRTSTGVETFVIDFSQNNNVVAQDGRRGALMLCLDINHPDILDFIRIKSDLTKVTGANLSVLLSNDFMKEVKNDKIHLMKFPIDSPFKPSEKIISQTEHGVLQYDENTETYWKIESAKFIWDEIIYYAWKVAEPGLLFKDNWYEYGTDSVYPEYKPIATNPCSEIAMQAYDSCRLMSYNLLDSVFNKYRKNATVIKDKLYSMFYLQMFLTDVMIDIEIKHIKNIIKKLLYDKTTPSSIKEPVIILYEKILKNTQNGRRCGCGFMGLGDLMAALNLRFEDIRKKDSKTYKTIKEIFEIKRNAELDCSIDLAVIHGPFAGFKQHVEEDINQKFFQDDSPKMKEIIHRMRIHGRRNVSFSTAAPTGTISIMAGVTSGIEPLFMPFYKRRVKIDGTSSDEYDYVDVDGNKFREYNVVHPGLIDCYSDGIMTEEELVKKFEKMSTEELQEKYETSPYYKQTANDIDYKDRIALQRLVQQYTTHSISSTINLPSDIEKEKIGEIYFESWKNGLKGNTVYRDGCRGGVIVSVDKKQQSSTKRPKVLKSVLHKLNYNKNYYAIIIGFLDDKPYEIFIMSASSGLNKLFNEYDDDSINGIIVKNDNNDYDFFQNEDESETPIIICDLDEQEDREQRFMSLVLSRLMRKGESMDNIMKILKKSEPIAGTFTYRLCKILSIYKETFDEKCPSCGSKLTRENGCVICKNCGWSEC